MNILNVRDENGNFVGVPAIQGPSGDTGNGISSVSKTGTSGLVDTYTVLFTSGSSTTFTVTNGEKGDTGNTGATGNGISSVVLTSTVGLVKTYTITFTSGDTTTFTVTDGEKGDKGDAFTIEMTYASVSAMNAGYDTDGVSIGGYVIISPSDTSDPDYGKVYQKGSTEYEYIVTMIGAKGDDGYTPVKGVDYFTDSEIAEIESTVYTSLSEGILGDIESVLVEINDGGTSE